MEFLKYLKDTEERKESAIDSENEDLEQRDNIKRPRNEVEKETFYIDEADRDRKLKHKLPTIRKPTLAHVSKSDQSYVDHVKEKFHSVFTCSSDWAKMPEPKEEEEDKEEDEEDDDNYMSRANRHIQTSNHLLRKDVLEYKQCKQLHMPSSVPQEKCFENSVKNIEFHPTAQVAMVATLGGSLILYQVDGKYNHEIQKVSFQDFRIHCAHFTPDGEKIIAGSKHHNYYYIYNMLNAQVTHVPGPLDAKRKNLRNFAISPDGQLLAASGNSGIIYILSLKSHELIASLSQNGYVQSYDFSKDGTRLYSYGERGQVHIWDMNTRKCLHRFTDHGSLKGTALAVSPDHHYLATGSDSAIVNLYNVEDILASTTPNPIKIFSNLRTQVDNLKFNATSEILAFASSWKETAIKLGHIPSRTVFRNFPKEGISLPSITCLDFSTNSGYLATGTSTGHVRLFRLNHYTSY